MKIPGECNFFGLGGMKAENVSDSLLVKLRLYAPDVVFIHIGANDISKDSSCQTICENIQSLVGVSIINSEKLTCFESVGSRYPPKP
jgi:hypothetical protein